MKTSAVTPTTATATVMVSTAVPQCVQISLDLGSTKVPIFTLTIPYQGNVDEEAREIAYEGVLALLDELTAFMLERKVTREVIVALYASALGAFQNLSPETFVTEFLTEEPVKLWESEFDLPIEFAMEMQSKVVTAAVHWRLTLDDSKYAPKNLIPIHQPGGRVREVKLKSDYTQALDAIRKYRNQTLQRQSGPLFVMVYNSNGKPVGVQQAPKVNQGKIWKVK